jgi:predicted  nucleic acid-binding Zn-ribbon protein
MSEYVDGIASVGRARAARDEARDRLYALQLRRLALAAALRDEARGQGAADPAAAATLQALRDEEGQLETELAAIGQRLADLQTLAGEADAVRAQVAALEEEAATLASEIAQLGGRLRDAAELPLDLAERLRALQQRRAMVEEQVQPLRDRLAELEREATAAPAEQQRLHADEAADRERLAEVQRALAAAEQEPPPDLASEAEANAREIAKQRAVVAELDGGVRQAIGRLFGDLTPDRLIEAWDDAIPILMLPLRVETRWRTEDGAHPELWVRVYPDDVAVTTHERTLTDAEVMHGEAYWTALRAATEADARDLAWRGLADRFGANRAAWVALATKPLNWDQALADASLTLQFPPQPVTKPDDWTEAPHTRVLPDRLALLAIRGGVAQHTAFGAPIDDIVVLGPSPIDGGTGDGTLDRDPGDGTLTLGEDYRWVRDFDAAVERGLAFKLAVTADDVRSGFDQLLVLGVKLSADGTAAKSLVEMLIDNHHYSRPGFAIVAQGTPTNNTGGNDTPYTRAGRTPAESVAEAGPPLFTPVADRTTATDGQRLGDYLGIAYDPLLHVDGADVSDHAEAVAMNRALWAGTLGYYLDHMLNEVVDEAELPVLRGFFSEHVTGRGPIAAVRVGSQPYGILPTSVLTRWQPEQLTQRDPRLVVARLDAFESALYRVLAQLDNTWSTLAADAAHLARAGDVSASLLDVLGLQPTSAEFFQRVGYSYDYLKNLEAFTWGGHDFDDVLKMAIEGMQTRGLLAQLGYSATRADGSQKPLPLLLELIWRHYQTRLDATQLIDGLPLSETAGIKPYDAATGANYVDWLLANAANADALEAQDFGPAPRPDPLLYLMLHYSLVMEASRGLFGWLDASDVQANELIRSRKFMNVGPQASPSVWEVFRAPADRVVTAAATDSPLLELVQAPHRIDGAGSGVQEQRDGLTRLRALPTARLERGLVEHLDTLSYRLDAWQTALVARRLHRQRRLDSPPEERRTGVCLGAFGYLEQVRPDPRRRRSVPPETLRRVVVEQRSGLWEEVGNGGYVHAPSLNHATAAALLRNGYLTHATPDLPDTLAVNLSSDRVRRAMALIEGIAHEQSLEVLLGVQFERGLHDWTTRPTDPVILDQVKPVFRTAFPLKRTRVPQAADASEGAAVITEDEQVVNGLDLATTTQPFPYGVTDLPPLDATQQAAIEQEKGAIENSLDALRDVLTAEAAYQLALGNFDRAAAVVQSVGSGTPPPDVEVVRTPRGTGISFTNRLTVQLRSTVVANPWPAVPLTERARTEPTLNNWLGGLLGDPAEARCRVRAVDTAGNVLVIGGAPAEATVSVADLGIQPIDLVYCVRSQEQQSGAAELESRIRYRFARDHAVPDDAVVQILFADAGGGAARPLSELLPLIDRLRRLLGAAKPLDARHFQSASKDTPAPPDNPGSIDVAELRARVRARLNAVRAQFTPLRNALVAARTAGATAADVDALRDALAAVALNGFTYALPVSAVGAGATQVDALGRQADSVLARFDTLSPATDDQLAAVDAPGGTAPEKAALLTDAAKAWLGADFVLIPHFTYLDATAVAAADAARAQLVAYARGTAGMPLPVDEWLHGAACVRPPVHDFELVRMIADSAGGDPLELAPIQLPFRMGDSWLGVDYPPTMDVVHDTVSVVQHLPHGFDASGAQCGLLVDEWVETVPTREEVTGLTFNFNAPDSAPPQALLLAVTPEVTGHWRWNDLVDTVLDTFRRARMRAVEPDRLGDVPGVGTLLPALVAEFSTGAGSVSLDYSFVVTEIRERVGGLQAAHVAGGGG